MSKKEEPTIMEYVMTYGWLIIIIVILGVAVWRIGTFTEEFLCFNDTSYQVTPGLCVEQEDIICYGSDNMTFEDISVDYECTFTYNVTRNTCEGTHNRELVSKYYNRISNIFDRSIKRQLFKTGCIDWACYIPRTDLWYEVRVE